jgi:hypothetical protein
MGKQGMENLFITASYRLALGDAKSENIMLKNSKYPEQNGMDKKIRVSKTIQQPSYDYIQPLILLLIAQAHSPATLAECPHQHADPHTTPRAPHYSPSQPGASAHTVP